MTLDDYQQAWKSTSSQMRVTIKADVLRDEVRQKQLEFGATVLMRDFVEVGVALGMIPIWLYLGVTSSLPWTWYLTVPVLIWIAGFIIVDRQRHPQRPCDPGEPILVTVKKSLSQVEHQIWLLRNVFWWYLLPPSISIMAFFSQTCWQLTSSSRAAGSWWEFPVMLLSWGVSIFVVYGVIYLVNQSAVRSKLEPRRKELSTLLESLSDETLDRDSFEIIPATVSPFSDRSSGLTPGFAKVAAIVSSLAVVGVIVFVVWLSNKEDRTPKSSGTSTAGSSVAPGTDTDVPAVVLDVPDYDQPAQFSGPMGETLARSVSDLRTKHRLVGLAAMVMVNGEVEAAAVHGERMVRSNVPLEVTDRWHLGGITASVTATVIARLVESGRMNWMTTISEVFPEASLHEDWKAVTMLQLLTHTAGAPVYFSDAVKRQFPAPGSECTNARRLAVFDVIAQKKAIPAGTSSSWSSVGYSIAGAMAEKVTGLTWEDLVTAELFQPLKLTGSGFGPPKSPNGVLPQPRGHLNQRTRKIAASDNADNSSIVAPAATAHMPLHDLCVFATEHMAGDSGGGKLLSNESYQVLHRPVVSGVACGWIVRQPTQLIPHQMYWSNGTNTLWYAMVVFIPETRTVVAVTANDGDMPSAESAAWEIVTASVKLVDHPTEEQPSLKNLREKQ